ncbi:LysM peptidoglycan-binding domain-containing protein [Salsuginibacillus kocurii]|uniref:LysM peptidoglycan-binding domain-containing protein n=1 Tax=Salsuginibacillus kocurii TaxID=427078 RepID=UPI000369EFDF|nr:LysM peptidoglycan-binding domain-containing protein [Salsuginibacillus kocurii]
MGNEHTSTLSFTMEESVWLDQEQRIGALKSLELEPDITIKEFEDSVSIEGGLHLSGTYQPVTDDERKRDTEAPTPPQIVNEASILQSGEGFIRHYFPIEISIPLHRINSIDDVYVQIDSFDYDLPDPTCIQLAADVTVSGMTEEREEPEAEPTEPTEASSFPVYEQDQFNRASIHEYREENSPPGEPEQEVEEANQLEDETVEEEERLSETDEATYSTYEPASNSYSVEEEEDESESELYAYSPQRENTTQTGEHRPQEIEEYVVETEQEGSAVDEAEDVEELSEEPVVESVEELEEETKVSHLPLEEEEQDTHVTITSKNEHRTEEVEDESYSAEEESESGEEVERPTTASTLTNILSLEGEEDYTSWRLCIVQDQESLDTIATRYNVTSSQLIRWNSLRQEQVEVGDLLYIPKSESKTIHDQ